MTVQCTAATAARFAPPRNLLKTLCVGVAVLGTLASAACDQKPQSTASGGLRKSDLSYAEEVLTRASAHGFAPGAFAAKGDAESPQALQAAVLQYAKAQHGLAIPASARPKAWGAKPKAYDAAADMQAAIQRGEFRQWLDAQAPSDPQYRALQENYAAYLKIAADGGWPQVAASKLEPGAAAPALRQRLAYEDPLLKDQDTAAPFDAGLAAALGRFQTAHGLKPTGALDKDTLAALNVPAQQRAAQIRASLERLRWLPRDEPANRVDVNIASAVMTYFENGRPAVRMLAASGKPGDETPMLTSSIDSIVLNPPWNVPEGIAQEELLPKGQDYLDRNNFTTGEGGRLIQKPGPDSALGLVKFDFDNPYAVYLHDTPSKAAFSRTDRAVSHGCVRLEKAVDFAKLLLSREPGWSPQRVDEVLASRETTNVKLSQPTPVRLMYLTAFFEDGRMNFRDDVYGWDSQLLALLDNPSSAAKVAKSEGPARRS